MSDQPATGPTGPGSWDPTASGQPTGDPTAAGQPTVGDPAAAGPPTADVPGSAAQPAEGDPAAAAQPTGNAPAWSGPDDPTRPASPSGWSPGATQPQGWDPVAPQPQGLRPAAPQPQGWDPAAPAPTGGQGPQGWVFPPTGGFPPGAGPYGGYPPGTPIYPGGPAPYAWYPPGHGFDPGDPLVNPPYAGLNGWFSRCVGAFRRSWRVLVPIMLLTQALPSAALALINLTLDPSAELATAPTDATGAPVLPDTFVADLAVFGSAVLIGALIFGLVQSIGWAGGTWAVTRHAAGEPVGLGAALRYGLRRAVGLWGWSLLVGLLVGVGVCFCVLPGIYLAFALALAGPVYLYERSNPIGRSFRIFHDRLGLVLGRVALVAAAIIVGSVVGGVLEAVGILPFGADPMSSPASALGAAVVILVTAALIVPVHLVQLIGLLVTYAEQRAHEGPVNTARLAAELG